MALASATFFVFVYVLMLLAATASLRFCDGEELKMTRKLHVVYMGDPRRDAGEESDRHLSILRDILGGDSNSGAAAEAALVRSYGKGFSGFAAWLTDEEATKINELEGVVSVFPDRKLKLHTTKSWDFMGFTAATTRRYRHEGDVIVGMIDSGIWPESPSFSDEGLSPPPARWNGTCDAGAGNFTCNNKIIGARFYNSYGTYDPTDIKSPRDTIGHGTHTASTVAGVDVAGASFFGLTGGTARGAVPGSRIAVYKVCWTVGECNSTDILAAFDDAIADGVDILSVSLGNHPGDGGPDGALYFNDPIAIGSFHAMKKGILTVFSAGNDGPGASTVGNTSPWAITVAASSIDRRFITKLILGNGLILLGNSINTFPAGGKPFPLIYGGDAPNASAGFSSDTSRHCFPGSINALKASGAVVLCDNSGDSSGVVIAGGVGMVTTSRIFDTAFSYPLLTASVTPDDGDKILEYIRSVDEPIAAILAGETIDDDVMAPMVASFSSRGPNPVVPDLLKPDITAPGIDILAAWSPMAAYPGDTRLVAYNVISGTSMSCPHVSGAAAYIKSARPRWSPAAIKSALMTTAMKMDRRKNRDAEFAYGAGHIDPLRALHPGLVFDASEKDYLAFLCKQGYNTTQLRQVSGDPSARCRDGAAASALRSWELNYPSFAVAVADGETVWAVFPRTVTNVGTSNSTYRAAVDAPAGVTVTVSPPAMSFSRKGETRSFTVTVSGGRMSQQAIVSGSVTWTDGRHVVRSPVVVHTVLPAAAAAFSSGASNGEDGRNGVVGRT